MHKCIPEVYITHYFKRQNNTYLLVMCMKAADPTMLEAVSKPELPASITYMDNYYIRQTQVIIPLPRIRTDCPSKSAGSIDTDSYPCSVGIYHVVSSMELAVPLQVLSLRISQECSEPTYQYYVNETKPGTVKHSLYKQYLMINISQRNKVSLRSFSVNSSAPLSLSSFSCDILTISEL